SRRSLFPPSTSHQSSTSSWGTIAASRTTAATSVPFHGQRSTLAQSSTSGRSHTSGCRSTTRTICRQGVCAADELGLTSQAPTPTFGAAKYFADAMSRENVDLSYRVIDAFNRRDLGAYLALIDPEVEFTP